MASGLALIAIKAAPDECLTLALIRHVMGIFDERLRGEEARFVARQQRELELRNRRNELFATWVARELLELPEADVSAYVAAIKAQDLDTPDDADVLAQMSSALEARGLIFEPESIGRRLAACARQAARESA